MTSQTKGVLASLSATCTFGGLYYYATLLAPLNGVEIFGWRIAFTLPFPTVLLIQAKHWHFVYEIAGRLRKKSCSPPPSYAFFRPLGDTILDFFVGAH